MILGDSLMLAASDLGGPDSTRAPRIPTIAIIGGGPRGISVLERMLLRAGATDGLNIDVYDQVSPGSGRVWDPRQSGHLLMNTPAQEVTIFSGPGDGGPVRAGAGPSLAEWSHSVDRAEYRGYETRRQYGMYLRFALEAMIAHAGSGIRVRCFTDIVVEIRSQHGDFLLTTGSGVTRVYDCAVLATGHPQPESPSPEEQFDRRVIAGDSASDQCLDGVTGDMTLAAVGMGLGFHDVVALLTQGRGGAFSESESGEIEYHASGDEPTIVGLSRSGLPILARGRNEKPPNFSFTPRLCTVESMLELRRSGPLDFYRDVHPWITAEITATFYASHLAVRTPAQAVEFLTEVTHLGATATPSQTVRTLGAAFGVHERLPSLEAMARPFGDTYTSQADWTVRLQRHLRADLTEAEQGNVTNPLKAALDTLRDLRPSIRAAVNFGGLTPESHEQDFLGRFVPAYSILAAGPPARRNDELLALMRAGIVRIAGPSAQLSAMPSGRYRIESPSVAGVIEADSVVDTRIPPYIAGAGRSVLYRQLLASGLVRRYRHGGASSIETGACETDPDTGQSIGVDGNPVAGLFIIGIPTERQRWFTQIGNSRPGVHTEFTADADRVAVNCLTRTHRRVGGMTR